MYKVPRERKKERTRPFVNSLRFKPPLKTLFELRKCVFRERRRIESREKLLCGWVKTNRKKRVFPQKQSKRDFPQQWEKRVLGVDRLFRPLVLKKAFYSKLAEKEPKRELSTQRKRKNEKRGRKSTDRKLHFSKQTEERKTTYSYKRE